MNQEQLQPYLNIIQQFLNCSNNEELNNVLQKNPGFINDTLLQIIEKVAKKFEENRQENEAKFLRLVSPQLTQIVNQNYLERSFFLMRTLLVITTPNANPQTIYPYWEENQQLLDQTFAQVLTDHYHSTLSSLADDVEKGYFARTIGQLGNLITRFTSGNRAINLEIGIACYNNALEVYSPEAYGEDWATTQNNLGLTYSERIKGNKVDNLEKAIAYSQNALEIHTCEAFPADWAKTQQNLVIAYINRIKEDKSDNLEKAIAHSQNILEIYTREAFPVQWADTQSNLSVAYWQRIKGNKAENLELAIACCENALVIRTRKAFPILWAETQNNLAIAYWQRIKGDKAENQEKAITCYQNALEIYTHKAFPVDWAETHNNLGLAYSNRIKADKADNIESAIASYKNTLLIFTREAFPVKWATTQHNLGLAYRNRIKGNKADNLKLAINLYREALTIHTPEALPLESLETNKNLGTLGFKEGNWNIAIEGYTKAIEVVEILRSKAISEIRRQEIMADAIRVYFNIVQSHINLEQLDKAIEYVERSKTRDLVELLANRDLYPKGNIPQAVIDELDYLRREIVTEEKQLANQETNLNNNLKLGNSPDTLQPTIPDRTKLNQLQQQLDNLIKDKITPEDSTFSLTQKVETISFAQIKNLTDNNTAIIQWYITADKILTFIVTADSNQPIIQQSTSENLQALIEEINNYLNLYLSDKKQWQLQLPSFLEKFAQHLHLDETIAKIPDNCKKLILIPHRFIHLLPIHALPITKKLPSPASSPLSFERRGAGGEVTETSGEKAKYLLDLFPNGIKYTPSCQLLQLVNQQQRDNFDNLFGIQNPLNDLTYTNIEVDTIRELFKPNDQVLIKHDATKENLTKQQLNKTNCTHFSTHGYFNFQEPLKSALLLANCLTQNTETVNKNSSETLDLERCLTLGEIFNLDLRKCSLVTLSACETGLTDLRNVSDEYISLPSGFLFAGSTNVISSLWAVNDLSTAFLIIKFYHNHIQEKLPITQALNEAQNWLRKLKKEELTSWIKTLPLDSTLKRHIRSLDSFRNLPNDAKPFESPYYWAAFCAIGK